MFCVALLFVFVVCCIWLSMVDVWRCVLVLGWCKLFVRCLLDVCYLCLWSVAMIVLVMIVVCVFWCLLCVVVVC